MSGKNLFLQAAYPRAPFGLGIGRYVCQLQRVTLKFCKTHGASIGVRKFVENNLIDYAKENPGVVVYLKPRRHRNPVIKAEFLNGESQWMCVANYTHEDIAQWMELLKTQFHDGTSVRLRKLWHTEFPSIQGPWTPFTFREPSMNLAKFPDKKLGEAVKLEPTATEELIRLFKEQQEAEKLKELEKKVQQNVG